MDDDAKIVRAGTRHVVYQLRCPVGFQRGEVRNRAEWGEDVQGFLVRSRCGKIGL